MIHKTSIIPTVSTPPVMTTLDLPQESNIQTHCAFAKMMSMPSKVYSDQISRFPQTSSCGNKYVMILYDHHSSAILAEPLKSRSESELLRAFTKLRQHLTARGLCPALHILDNECLKGLKNYIKKSNATLG